MEVTEPAADVRAESCNMKLHAVFILFDNKPQSRRNTREIEVVRFESFVLHQIQPTEQKPIRTEPKSISNHSVEDFLARMVRF
ncbi:hypothetical protein F2Q69_00054214 [Brassica cretica]|uniref:Uncharacterized protein n=1 Tax=Brassica cretica TaxID=69181 RepID=A0A8S9N108_BRACR|nr:hypothetical protein F2Q69_00054214 [Brassica cretica]